MFRFIIDRFLSRIGHGTLRILAKIQLRDICLFAGGWIKAKSKKMTFVVYFKTVTHLQIRQDYMFSTVKKKYCSNKVVTSTRYYVISDKVDFVAYKLFSLISEFIFS